MLGFWKNSINNILRNFKALHKQKDKINKNNFVFFPADIPAD
tara:strand:+ start:937 stop:1062 length:126 start_codon:yes stop_codon:yes gene_type:complete